MIKTWFRRLLPFVAVAAIAFAAYHVWKSYGVKEPSPVSQDRLPKTPYPRSIAGSGIVEAQRKNIEIGAPASGIVMEVFVDEGQRVASGDPLFRIDDRELQAERIRAEAALTQALAESNRIKSLPRQEERPVYEAAVTGAVAEANEKEQSLKRLQGVAQTNVVTAQEIDTATRALNVAKANADRAKAQLAFFLEGASKEEIAVAEAAVDVAQGEVDALKTQIEIRTVRAPSAGRILDLEVRPGQYVSGQRETSLILFGREGALQVRVTIDEYDIPRFETQAKAVAMLKGNNVRRFPLVFDYVEPYVIPKQSLTGEATERIDTRVLPIVYQVGETDVQLYVGQQVDVFIEDLSEPTDDSPAPSAAPPPKEKEVVRSEASS